MAIGVGAAFAWGASFFAAGSIAAGVAGTLAAMAWGALVGAAIGGLSAAVTGGDIGKGVLYGAIGGAVAGGISGIANIAQNGLVAATTTGSTATGGTVGSGGSAVAGGRGTGEFLRTGAASGTGGSAGGGAGGGGVSGFLNSDLGAEVAKGGVEGAFKLGGGVLQGMGEQSAMEDKIKADREAAAIQLAASQEEAAKNREHAKEMAALTKPPDHFGEDLEFRREKLYAEIGENARQFDTQLEKAEASRKRSGNSLASISIRRKGTYKGKHKTIQEQVFEQSQGSPETVAPQLDANSGEVTYEAVA